LLLLEFLFGNKVESLLKDWLYITSLPKEIQLCFQFDSFSYGPGIHLISWKTFVSHLHSLRLLTYEILLEWKRLNGVTPHVRRSITLCLSKVISVVLDM